MTEVNYLTESPSERRRAERRALVAKTWSLHFDDMLPSRTIAAQLGISLRRVEKYLAEETAVQKKLGGIGLDAMVERSIQEQYHRERELRKEYEESKLPTIRTRIVKKTKRIKVSAAIPATADSPAVPAVYAIVNDGTEEIREVIENRGDPRYHTLIENCKKERNRLRQVYPKETATSTPTTPLVIVIQERPPTLNMLPPPLPITPEQATAMMPASFVFDEEPPVPSLPQETPLNNQTSPSPEDIPI
jgi:hypothetical protein